MLSSWQVSIVKSISSTRHESDLDLELLLHVVEELLESQRTHIDQCFVENGVTFRDRLDSAHGNGIIILGLNFTHLGWLREQEKRESQIDESILYILQRSVPLHELENFSRDRSSYHSRGSRDGWDNLACNHLSLMSVTVGDLVVRGSQVCTRVYEVNMKVGVIVLLKLSWSEIVLFDGSFDFLKNLQKLFDFLFVLWSRYFWRCIVVVALCFLLFWGLDNNFLGDILCNIGVINHINDLFSELSVYLLLLWDVQIGSDEVCICQNEFQVDWIFNGKGDWGWTSLWA